VLFTSINKHGALQHRKKDQSSFGKKIVAVVLHSKLTSSSCFDVSFIVTLVDPGLSAMATEPSFISTMQMQAGNDFN
jgi:hypothetical protein